MSVQLRIMLTVIWIANDSFKQCYPIDKLLPYIPPLAASRAEGKCGPADPQSTRGLAAFLPAPGPSPSSGSRW